MSWDSRNFYNENLEWDFFQKEFVISNPEVGELIKKLPGTPSSITIKRNDYYNFSASIHGKCDKEFFSTGIIYEELGKNLNGYEISGNIQYSSSKYKLNNCIYTWNVFEHFNEYDAELIIPTIQILNSPEKNEIAWISEWYLNGHYNKSGLNRITKRRYSENYSYHKDILNPPKKEFTGKSGENKSADHAYIQCQDFGIIIKKVPDLFGPDWSENLCIEYHSQFGRIPDIDEREAIREIISFILGKQLLMIGYTSYNEDGFPIEYLGQQPWGNNIKHLCRSGGLPPVSINKEPNKLEKILTVLIPKYLKIREELHLSDALWRYWIGKELPLGTNIPIIANGVEILRDAWFNSKKSKSKGVWIEKETYDEIISPYIDKIDSELKDVEYKKQIIDKIKNAYSMSISKQNDFFFGEIDLEIGKVETKAIIERNKMIHGTFALSEEKVQKMNNLSFAYKTLFHRIILKLLNYNEKYIDYSVEGFPEKHIDIPCGECE